MFWRVLSWIFGSLHVFFEGYRRDIAIVDCQRYWMLTRLLLLLMIIVWRIFERRVEIVAKEAVVVGLVLLETRNVSYLTTGTSGKCKITSGKTRKQT